jgi:hypothetical protein
VSIKKKVDYRQLLNITQKIVIYGCFVAQENNFIVFFLFTEIGSDLTLSFTIIFSLVQLDKVPNTASKKLTIQEFLRKEIYILKKITTSRSSY